MKKGKCVKAVFTTLNKVHKSGVFNKISSKHGHFTALKGFLYFTCTNKTIRCIHTPTLVLFQYRKFLEKLLFEAIGVFQCTVWLCKMQVNSGHQTEEAIDNYSMCSIAYGDYEHKLEQM